MEAVGAVNDNGPRPALRGSRWLLSALGLAGVIILVTGIGRLVPFDLWVPTLRTWVESRGVVGMVGFGAAYAVSALLFVPGAALTLVAGGVFGLGWGMVVVSIPSSVPDGAAFLIGRYLARDAVERLARRYRRFQALDTAITRGGWRVVALLRLSPTVPVQRQQLLLRADGHPVSSVLDYDLGVHPPRDVRLRLPRLSRGGNAGQRVSHHGRVVGPGVGVDRDGHGDDLSRRPGPTVTAGTAQREPPLLKTLKRIS